MVRLKSKWYHDVYAPCGIGFGAGGAGGGRPPPPPLFGPGGARGAHHFELQALVCIVFSGKVITLTSPEAKCQKVP